MIVIYDNDLSSHRVNDKITNRSNSLQKLLEQ